jgi:hypothetical protein
MQDAEADEAFAYALCRYVEIAAGRTTGIRVSRANLDEPIPLVGKPMDMDPFLTGKSVLHLRIKNG